VIFFFAFVNLLNVAQQFTFLNTHVLQAHCYNNITSPGGRMRMVPEREFVVV
jgi:hypothetical protein